ncbi:MAG: hypothetical protein IV107_15425 [Paucibacter sp.]|nr:hypothetical protein [Roseateles sp.]
MDSSFTWSYRSAILKALSEIAFKIGDRPGIWLVLAPLREILPGPKKPKDETC